jgi:hypothetical protein
MMLIKALFLFLTLQSIDIDKKFYQKIERSKKIQSSSGFI